MLSLPSYLQIPFYFHFLLSLEQLKDEKSEEIKQVKKLINDYQITMGSICKVIYTSFDSKGKGLQANLSNVKPKEKKQ